VIIMKKNINFLLEKKHDGIPVTMLTAYDYPTAKILDEAGIDSILVGDSVGTNVLGYQSEQEVTIADMLHHLRAVARAVKTAFVVVDLPFGTVDDPWIALENGRLLIENGADCVKVEGWGEKKNVIACLAESGIPVCAHIGYNPQIHGGKAKIFGKDASQAHELIESAMILQDAGANVLVIEKVPHEVGSIVSSRLSIPVIGIGSGNGCDGQVLVVHDILGMGERVFKHAKKYMNFWNLALKAVNEYKNDVVSRDFPSEENSWHMQEEQLRKIEKD
jgi:3-methyl-2-oxobutanoate hydroxymethyltransferase